MRRATKAIVGVVVIGLVAFFFLAPIVYWFSFVPILPQQNPPHFDVYRSLGCVTIGWGDIYFGQGLQGLQLTCIQPISI
jgi:hypothetical protein